MKQAKTLSGRSEQISRTRLYAVGDVAEMLGVSQKTVRREIAGGRLGCVRVGPAERQIRIKYAEVERYLRERSR